MITDLFQIIEVDERSSTWTVKMWFFFYYKVPSARWDPADYNGTWSINIPDNMFWKPQIC